MTTIEHQPWVGSLYKTIGLDGQRIAIVGHSHWGDQDSDDLTIDVMSRVISGEWRINFFSSIRNYFGFDDNGAFWNRVIFFNYLPHSVGPEENRYNSGVKEEIQRAKTRFLRIIAEEDPQKVLVFSNDERTAKGWPTLPPTREEEARGSLHQLGAKFPRFSWGTYQTGSGHIVMAFGLRHPQGANGMLMRRAVEHILAMPSVP